MKNVAKLINNGEKNIIVLSAMSGTTNSLVEIADYYSKNNLESAKAMINTLRTKYSKDISELYTSKKAQQDTLQLLDQIFSRLLAFGEMRLTESDKKEILSKGEIMSTNMMTNYLKEQGVKVTLISAFDFMRLDENGEPDMKFLADTLNPILKQHSETEIFITQGFICLNNANQIDNLQRGGSDYSASLIGAAIKAEEIQIWTDIDGMHNNDPRIVDNTKPVHQLHFEEAAELAYFGAKILHPTCVQPAKFAGIPVRLLNTMDPAAQGTIINNYTEEGKIKAVAAKDNITVIKIVSSRMLLATGFLRKVFEIFEQYHTSIDVVTTSEVGVSMTIDNDSYLANILEELKKYGTVNVDRDMCIICVVGDLRTCNKGFESIITSALKKVPVRMISYGGSNHNISFIIREADKTLALQELSRNIFNQD
jgi:aspartate kinase